VLFGEQHQQTQAVMQPGHHQTSIVLPDKVQLALHLSLIINLTKIPAQPMLMILRVTVTSEQ